MAGKVAIVTGGASGIGEATALRLAEEGAAVVVADVDGENGRRVAAAIGAAGGTAAYVRADLGRPAQIRQLMERTRKLYGRLDILHNNAIAFRHAPATELDEKGWDITLNVGVEGDLRGRQARHPADAGDRRRRHREHGVGALPRQLRRVHGL